MTEYKKDHIALLEEACLSNADAMDFLLRIGLVFRVWDDLIDKDRTVSDNSIENVFTDLCFDLSRNVFFRKHREVLESTIFLSYNAWMDANELTKSAAQKERDCAFFIREFCNELVQLCAWLLGGKKHARSISMKVRRFYLEELKD